MLCDVPSAKTSLRRLFPWRRSRRKFTGCAEPEKEREIETNPGKRRREKECRCGRIAKQQIQGWAFQEDRATDRGDLRSSPDSHVFSIYLLPFIWTFFLSIQFPSFLNAYQLGTNRLKACLKNYRPLYSSKLSASIALTNFLIIVFYTCFLSFYNTRHLILISFTRLSSKRNNLYLQHSNKLLCLIYIIKKSFQIKIVTSYGLKILV